MPKYTVLLLGPVAQWEDVAAPSEGAAVEQVAQRADYRFMADHTDTPHRLAAFEQPGDER